MHLTVARILLAQTWSLLANVSGRVEFYTTGFDTKGDYRNPVLYMQYEYFFTFKRTKI